MRVFGCAKLPNLEVDWFGYFKASHVTSLVFAACARLAFERLDGLDFATFADFWHMYGS